MKRISNFLRNPGLVTVALVAAFVAASVVGACRTGQTPWQNVVTDVTTVVDCTKATCAEAGPVCSQITAEVLACVPAIFTANPGVCASLLNFQTGKIAFADLMCIIDAFSQQTPDNALAQRYLATAGAPSLAEAQAAAAKFVASQHVGVIRAKAVK
jgi:phage tail protein X